MKIIGDRYLFDETVTRGEIVISRSIFRPRELALKAMEEER